MAAEARLAQLYKRGKNGCMRLRSRSNIRNRDAAFCAVLNISCYAQQARFGLYEQIIGLAGRVWARVTVAADVANY